MPHIRVGDKTAEFAKDKRLVNATTAMGIHIGHRCGGKAKCTTCRVEVLAGEPAEMTRAEYEKLKEKGFLGQYRLACQLTCTQDMTVQPMMTLETVEGWTDTGPTPTEEVEPEARWFPRASLE